MGPERRDHPLAMWTIIILVLFVIAAIVALALAMHAKPGKHRDGK